MDLNNSCYKFDAFYQQECLLVAMCSDDVLIFNIAFSEDKIIIKIISATAIVVITLILKLIKIVLATSKMIQRAIIIGNSMMNI